MKISIKKISITLISLCLLVANSWANQKNESDVWLRIQDSKIKQVEAQQNRNYYQKVNLSCGIPPIPPLGCKVGSCQCDQYGGNCKWTFICG